ncbi:MAG: DUF4046 domain-containing protein [Clostridiales bacterium]|nr:DUF4046 domain-containing protein [Clostridiales bacterium]
MSRKKRYLSIFYGIDPEDYVGIFNRVRKGYFQYGGEIIQVKTFPNGFWNKEVAINLVRYYVLEELKFTRQDYLNEASIKFFTNARLKSAVKQYNNSVYKLTKDAFPEWEIEPWELKDGYNGYLSDKKNCKKIMKWICKKEGINTRKKFCEKMNVKLFRKYGLGRAVVLMGGLYNYVNYVYPGKYKPWELNISKITDDIAMQAVKWLIEEELKWSKEEVCKNICANTFRDHGLESILSHKFGNSPIKALEFAYPGEYTKEMLEKWVKQQKKAVH